MYFLLYVIYIYMYHISYIYIVYKYVYTLNKILNVFFLIARLEIYLHDDDNSRRVLVSPVR